MGLFSSIAGIFGGVQEGRSAGEAVGMVKAAQDLGFQRSAALDIEGQKFLDLSLAALPESRGLLQKYLAQTEGLDVGTGLSGADRIAYEDAAKLLDERMVSTGNLRSGASAFGQSQLLSRVVAQANERRFGRDVSKLQLLFGGAGQTADVARIAGGMGLNEKSLSAQLLAQAMGLSVPAGQFELAKGAANAGAISAGGGALDTLGFAGALSQIPGFSKFSLASLF